MKKDHPTTWSWDNLEADAQKEAYANLLEDFRRVDRTLEAVLRIADRLPNY